MAGKIRADLQSQTQKGRDVHKTAENYHEHHRSIADPQQTVLSRPSQVSQQKFVSALETGSIDSTLKDKLTGFFSGMHTGNTEIIHRVQRMVSEQRNEIDMLTDRIGLLNKQVERQKSYYQKREQIIREMYEEELSLVEAHSLNSVFNHDSGDTKKHKDSRAIPFKEADKTSDAGLQCHNMTDSSTIKPSQKLPTYKPTDVGTSPMRVKSLDAACVTSPCRRRPPRPNLVTRAVQSDLVLALADNRTQAIDYHTCVDKSPFIQLGDKLAADSNTQMRDDEAFVEAERMHEKTQYLYGKLNRVLREFHKSSNDIVTQPQHKPRHIKPLHSPHSKPLVSEPKVNNPLQIRQSDMEIVSSMTAQKPSSDNEQVDVRCKDPLSRDVKLKAKAKRNSAGSKEVRRMLNIAPQADLIMAQLNHDRTVNSDVSTIETISGLHDLRNAKDVRKH